MKKIIVIGIDGATWNLIDPWVKAGILPNFGKLIKEGYSSQLISTIPPMTAPAWIAFSTGKNPGRHGVFDFFKVTEGKKEVIDSTAIRSKQIWEILSDAGKKVIVINPVISYPVPRVNGYLIAGMLTPSYQVNYTYPKSLKTELEKKGYKIGVELDPGMRSNWARSYVLTQNRQKRRKLINFFNAISFSRWQVFKELAKQEDFDFGFVLFEGADRLQHYYWQSKDFYVIKAYYRVLDHIIGEARQLVGNEGVLMLVSDHGLGEIKKKFYLNNLLQELGFLFPTESNRYIQILLKNAKILALFFAKIGLPLERLLTQRAIFRLYEKLYRPNIDLVSSQAYFFNETSRGIWIKEKDEEKYEKIRNQICKAVAKLKDPVDDKAVARAYKKEEIYQGPFVNAAPDLLVLTHAGYSLEVTLEEENLSPKGYLKKTSLGERNADHEMHGILIAAGAGIRKSKSRSRKNCPQIIDVAPSILKLMGETIPVDMDGRNLF